MIPPDVARRLRYRSQFVLGPRFVEGLADWTRTQLGHGLCLSTHPDLDVTHAGDGVRAVTLLGFLLDPFDPGATNADLVAGLLRELAKGTDLLAHSERFGGRWILIVDDGRAPKLFHDATALRQVYHTDAGRVGEVWCGTQPVIIAGLLGLEMDPDAVQLVAEDTRPTREHRLPAAAASHIGMRRLQPNHYLDLTSGTPRRYWPLQALEPMEFAACVEAAAPIMAGLMESAARRFPLAVSMTAGRDSRLVLAAARRVAAGLTYVTVAKPGRVEDVEIPAKLLPSLGLTHTVIPWPSDVSEEFAQIFKTNVAMPHDVYVPEAYAVFTYNTLTKVAVTGSVAELIRPPRRLSRFGEDNDEEITPERLTTQMQMGTNKFALGALGAWLEAVPRFGRPTILDLHRWENGPWLATTVSEFDTAWRDVFTPFNCRLLLVKMMGVEHHLRCGPHYRLAVAMIRYLWPELLRVRFSQRTKQPPLISSTRVRHVATQMWRKVERRAPALRRTR